MKEDNNDILLNEFFAKAHDTEIPDAGFSDRVMLSIGEMSDRRLVRLSHIWTALCAAVGIAFIAFSLATANIHMPGTEDIVRFIMLHIANMVKGLSASGMHHIPLYVYPLPLTATILLAISVMRRENRSGILN